MMKFSEQLLTTPLKTAGTFESTSPTPSNEIRRIASASGHDNKLSLTLLWEFVVRTKSLPEGLDLNVFFQVIRERLQNPEREVRQHALRVLLEVVTVIDSAILDAKMQPIVPDLITNLGHVGPAVRKGAIDCLKVYLNYSNNTDNILRDIVYSGVEKSNENKTRSNVVTGVIIALPFLIKKANRNTLNYVIRVLSEKMIQITFQEIAIKSLVRIKDIIGDELFDECNNSSFKKNFTQLCEVYNVYDSNLTQGGIEKSPCRSKSVWNDLHQEIVEDNDLERQVVKSENEITEDKVILETEIKLNSGSAITMQIHEESRHCATLQGTEDYERNGLGIVKILTDESEDYYESRRTPRRVRFGGEIVKLRTPDSDSNQPSDLDNTSSITITPSEKNEDTHLIEIHRSTSQIPVKKSNHPHSEPTSPVRINSNNLRKLSRSSPNLNDENVFGEKVSSDTSKIPRRNEKITKQSASAKDQKLSHTTTIHIKFAGPRMESNEKRNAINREKKTKKPPPLKVDKFEQKSDDSSNSTPIHKEIEIFHNLTRSPERRKNNSFFDDRDEDATNVDRNKNDIVNFTTSETSSTQIPSFNNTYSSFQVCDTSNVSESFVSSQNVDSPIPTNDNGDCLTCSSSGSDALAIDSSWEKINLVDGRIIRNLKFKDDWRVRLKGLEQLNKLLQEPKIIKALEPKASSLLFFLFGCEQQSKLQAAVEDSLKLIFSKMSTDVLRTKLSQIVTALCKMGSSPGVRLSVLLMRRITAYEYLNHLLSDTIMKAKSSKIREGALQILMTISRIFPSTEINVPNAVKFVTPLLQDRKKRVRRASLETLASLAQLASPLSVLDVLTQVALESEYSDKEQLIKVVRARLSRKQLPTVDTNGSVRYSTPNGDSELEWISSGSAAASSLTNQSTDTTDTSYDKLEQNHFEKGHLERINYWKTNARKTHITDANLCEREEESDWSRDSIKNKDDVNSQNLQIWTVDPWTLSAPTKLSMNNDALRPLYIFQKDTVPSSSSNSAESYKVRTPRGRSYSPPKRKVNNVYKGDERERFIAVSKDEDFKCLHKSISSDQIRNGKYMSSSTSSTTSDAALRVSNWSKNFKSAIPVPVSSDSRIRFRTRHNDVAKGPLSIPLQMYRTKSPTPERTPERKTVSQRGVLVRQPFSSSSELSELYTPPAEPHLPNQVLEESIEVPRQPENFVEIDSPRYHVDNFTVIKSVPDVLEQNKIFSRANSVNSQVDIVNLNVEEISLDDAQTQHDLDDYFQTQDEVEEELEKKVSEINSTQTITIHDLETFKIKKTYLESNLSKSEVNLQISTEVSRKSVNSAPALNENYESKQKDFTIENSILPGATDDLSSCQTFVTEIKTTPIRPPLVRQLSRKNSVKSSKRDGPSLLEDLHPFAKPKDGFSEVVGLLDHTEWEMTIKGLQGVARLTRYHRDICDLHMHAICVALGKHIKNLRSQVARTACLVASEMFANHRRSLEVELEEIAVPLLHRTADTNKFLRSDANASLDKMCLHLAAPRVVSIISLKGGGHQNAVVRCAASRLLCSITNRLGAEKVFQLPKDTRDKILHTGANMLMEGNLETRKHAKMMFGNLMGHSQFNKAMMEAVSTCTMRHIQKTLKSLQ